MEQLLETVDIALALGPFKAKGVGGGWVLEEQLNLPQRE